MEFTPLGRTGLNVSVAGLGCGGASRLGLQTGGTESNAIRVVHSALDLGINLVDTAARYGTEDVVGRALATVPRDSVIISTKAHGLKDGEPPSVVSDGLIESLEQSLRNLQTDYIDIFHIHGLMPEHNDLAREHVVPRLQAARDAGKIRFIGVTESGTDDTERRTMPRAATDDCWDVIMVACHMLHQRPITNVLRPAAAHGIGTLLMYVVRALFSRPERLREVFAELAAVGSLPAAIAAEDPPLGFLLQNGAAASKTDAAYRFARHETGANVVLTGTGNCDHLTANVASILAPPLPAAAVQRLHAAFGDSPAVGLDRVERPVS